MCKSKHSVAPGPTSQPVTVPDQAKTCRFYAPIHRFITCSLARAVLTCCVKAFGDKVGYLYDSIQNSRKEVRNPCGCPLPFANIVTPPLSSPVVAPPQLVQTGTHGLLGEEWSCLRWYGWVLPHASCHSSKKCMLAKWNSITPNILIRFLIKIEDDLFYFYSSRV